MQITEEMRTAITLAIEQLGSAKELGSRAAVDNSLLGKYRSGSQPVMEEETWEKLYPHVRAYLPGGVAYLPRSQWADGKVQETPAAYTVPSMRRVPVYGLAMAKGVSDWHGDVVPDDESQLDTIDIPDDGRRYAAFKVEGDSMEPEIRDGATVLADLDIEPVPGNIVLAKWDDTVMVKRYRRYGRQIVLESINPRYEPVQVKPAWMLRVKRVMFEV